MKFRRQRPEEVGVNVTPLIDVVFLLLIFFMVTTTFTKESHLTVDLPEASGEKAVENPERIDILINAAGQYAINEVGLVDTNISTLMVALRRVSSGDTKRPLSITADAQTPHQAVVRAMDAAGQLGFVHLSITTRDPEASG
ncbi:MAG: biopolymer transport protein ExbD [Halieaceae bacterium]